MNATTSLALDPKMQAAVEELEALILRRHPGTQFRLSGDPEGSEAVHLTAVVDVDEPDEVLDLVLDRAMEMLINDDLSIVVVPVRTPDRAAAMRAAVSREIPHAMPPASDVHERIRRWLADEGWQVRDVPDPDALFYVMITFESGHMVGIYQRKQEFDRITAFLQWDFNDEFREEFSRWSPEAQRDIIHTIYRDTLTSGLDLSGLGIPPRMLYYWAPIYFDGLTKDSLMQKIFHIIRIHELSKLTLTRGIEEAGHSAEAVSALSHLRPNPLGAGPQTLAS